MIDWLKKTFRPGDYIHRDAAARLATKMAVLAYEDIANGLLTSAGHLDEARMKEGNVVNSEALKAFADGMRRMAQSYFAKRDLVLVTTAAHEPLPPAEILQK